MVIDPSSAVGLLLPSEKDSVQVALKSLMEHL